MREAHANEMKNLESRCIKEIEDIKSAHGLEIEEIHNMLRELRSESTKEL